MKITRHEEFEVAHVLPDYPGACGNLHGHTYKIEVTVEGPQHEDNYGMVLDFNILKEVIKKVVPDHRFVYNNIRTSPLEKDILKVLNNYGCKSVGYPFCTTAENMSKYFSEAIEQILIKDYNITDVQVVEVKLWETTNSFAYYTKEI